jgi:hypothetical protein
MGLSISKWLGISRLFLVAPGAMAPLGSGVEALSLTLSAHELWAGITAAHSLQSLHNSASIQSCTGTQAEFRAALMPTPIFQ